MPQVPETSIIYNQPPRLLLVSMTQVCQVCEFPVSTGAYMINLLTSLIAESWASKRFERSTSDAYISLPRPDLSPLTKGIESHSRKQCTRDQKGPETTGPVQTPPYKLYALICVLLLEKCCFRLISLLMILESQIPTSRKDRSQQISTRVLNQGRHRSMRHRGLTLPHSRLLASKMVEMSQAPPIFHLHTSLTTFIIAWSLMSPISALFLLQEGVQSSHPENWATTF